MEITKELAEAVKQLYDVFSCYPFKPTMEVCPCCVSDADKEQLHSNQLHELSEDDLSRYTAKAIYTWGDEDDFKHYLPRIFELASTTNFIVDTFIVLEKLNLAGWTNWSEDEQSSVKRFLYAWWENELQNKGEFNEELFIECYTLMGDLNALLSKWIINFSDFSFITYIDFIQNHLYSLIQKDKEFKVLKDKDRELFIKWMKQESKHLEDGYFHFEENNKELAQKASNALYIIERAFV